MFYDIDPYMVSGVIDLENVDAIFQTLFLLLIRLWQRSKAKKNNIWLTDSFVIHHQTIESYTNSILRYFKRFLIITLHSTVNIIQV